MIDEIGLHAVVPGEHVREELLSELRFAMEQILHCCPIDANDRAGFKCARRGSAMRLTRQEDSPKKLVAEVGDYSFLAVHRYDGELHLAALDVKTELARSPCEKMDSPVEYSRRDFSGMNLMSGSEGRLQPLRGTLPIAREATVNV